MNRGTGGRPSAQMVRPQSIVARNHVAHAVAEIPPALVTTGRCDLLDGHAAAWTH